MPASFPPWGQGRSTPTDAPAVRFTYGQPTLERGERQTIAAQTPVHAGTNTDLHGTLLDVDGDGMADRVSAGVDADGSCELRWRRGLFGGGFSSQLQRTPLPTLP